MNRIMRNTGVWNRVSAVCFLLGMGLLWGGVVLAEGLRVSPITLEWTAPDSTAMLTLENRGDAPVNVQIRILRWTQQNGDEQLIPTNDMVASPPITQLAPEVIYSVRVVRVAKTPVVAEESYRVLVDEIPDQTLQRAGAVSFVLRHSIPVFIRSLNASLPKPSWRLQKNPDGATVLVVHNAGDGRIRLADLSLSQGGRRLGAAGGLVGYVLGGATMQWPVTLTAPAAPGPVTVSAQTQMGPMDTSVAVEEH